MTAGRFALRAMVLVIFFMAALSLVARPITLASTWAAKFLHDLVGLPAPHLLVENDTLYTAAICLSPLLGLALAASWISWRRRIAVVSVGIATVAILLISEVILGYSPYLPHTPLREQVKVNLLLFAALPMQVVIWMSLVGLDPAWTNSREVGAVSRPQWIRRACFALILVSVSAGLLVIVCARVGRSTTAAARGRLARDYSRHDHTAALSDVFEILRSDPDDLNVIYFGAFIARAAGREELSRVMLFQSCTRAGLENRYYREYDSPPPWPRSPASTD